EDAIWISAIRHNRSCATADRYPRAFRKIERLSVRNRERAYGLPLSNRIGGESVKPLSALHLFDCAKSRIGRDLFERIGSLIVEPRLAREDMLDFGQFFKIGSEHSDAAAYVQNRPSQNCRQ